jgi:hypothetical protein
MHLFPARAPNPNSPLHLDVLNARSQPDAEIATGYRPDGVQLQCQRESSLGCASIPNSASDAEHFFHKKQEMLGVKLHISEEGV